MYPDGVVDDEKKVTPEWEPHSYINVVSRGHSYKNVSSSGPVLFRVDTEFIHSQTHDSFGDSQVTSGFGPVAPG